MCVFNNNLNSLDFLPPDKCNTYIGSFSAGKKIQFTEIQIQEIKEAYLSGQSATSIAKQFGCAHTVITRLAKNYGYKRSQAEVVVSKLSCDQDYFEAINTEQKAYWLGFLYADGNVTDGKQPSLQLCLAERDASHVYALNQALNSSYNVGHYNYKNPVCQFRIPRKKLVKDLTALGCGPRKTFSILPPTTEQVPSRLVRHFIRGYFDGDGCFSDRQLIFLGTEKFLEWISSCMPFNHAAVVRKVNSKNIYRFHPSIFRKDKALALYQYFFNDATIWLERKRIKLSHALT